MRWRVGVDENGLGPQLGPMLVTGIMARVSEHAMARLRCCGDEYLHERLNDSKKLVDHHDVALGEAWARALSERSKGEVASPLELLSWLSLEDVETLCLRCPAGVVEQCWSSQGETYWASEEQVQTARADLEKLSSEGIDVVWAKSAIVCTRRLNEGRKAGIGRFHADLHSIEQLIVAAHQVVGEEIEANCGKVGGFRQYSKAFGILGDRLHTAVCEDRSCSSYSFPRLGLIHFRRDADGQDPLVALASLVGKYLRELLMSRIIRYYQRALPGLGDASGYNDPVTNRFVNATAGLRAARGIPDICFRRDQGSAKSAGI